MFSRLVISLVLIGKLRCVTSDFNTTDAQCSPTTDGTKRFGTACKYACHCINNEQCNYTTGECGSGCDFEWVGPSCQYKNIAHAELSRQIDNIYPAKYSYLANDNDSSTCSFTDSAVPEERLATRTVAPWWSLWLPYDATFRKLLFVTRHNYSSYFPFFKVTVHNISMSDFTNFVYRTNGVSCYQHDDYIPQDATFKVNCTGAPVGNQIRIQLANMSTQLVLCDFRVYGECKDRTWGKACNECGFCKDFSQCDATNGSCLSGCEPGYIPPLCSKANTYQTGCDCTDGYYCENTYEYPTICPTGHFCVNGLKSPCSAGTFTSNSGSAQCEQCTPGYYCPNLGLSTVTDVCWIGHYCPEGAVVPSPCPNGYYQTDTGKSDCIICPVNFYCNQTEAEVEKQSGTSKPTHGVVTPKECQPKRCLKPGLSGELDPFEIGGLSISISCKPSCRQHMTPFTDLKFMANCDGCENEVSSYQWSIRECFSEVIQECEHYVNSVTFLTESTGYYTAIPHNDKQNWTYIAVVVKVTLNDGREGMASHIWQYLEGVQVDCQTSPVSGVAGETRFTVICIEPALPVDKDNIRCSMSYAYSITGDSLIYQTNETCNHTGIILRQGDKTKDYRQHLKVVGMYIDHLIWDVPILLQVVLPSVTTDLLENAVDELSGNLTDITTTEEAFELLNGLQAVIYVLNEAPYVSNETSSDSSAENTVEILKEKKRKMQIRENIVSAITKVNTSNVEVMVSVTSTLNQVTLQKEELSTEIKDQAFEMYNTFVEKFQEMEETTSDEDVTRTAATLLFGVGSVFDITTDDYSEEVDKSKESQDTYDTDSSGDKTTPSPISKEENKQRRVMDLPPYEKLASRHMTYNCAGVELTAPFLAKNIKRFENSCGVEGFFVKERTEKLLKSVGVISEIVFKRQDVDSEPALFETPVLSIAVAKVSQKNLAGKSLKAEEGDEDSTTSLALPADLDLSDTGDSVRTEFVLMKKNPYVWGENSKNIKPPVLSLELKHSHNDVLQISNLSSPMKVNLAHDGGQVAGIIRLLLTVEKSNGTVALAPSRGRPCAATFELSVEREKVTSFSLSLPGNVTALVSIGLHTKFNVTSIIGLGFRYPNDIQIIRQFYSMLSETEAETFDNASRYCELCTEFCCNSMAICTGFYEHCIYYCKHVIQNNVTENCTEIFNATVYCDSCQNLCCNGTTNCTSVLENCLFFCSLYREESLTAECRNHLYYSNLSALGTTVKQYCEECDTFCCGGTEECADMYSNCIFFCSNFMSENVTLSCGKNKKSLETIYLFPRESRKNDTSYQMYFALSVDPTDTYVLEHFSQIDPNCLGNVSVNSCTVDIDLQVPLKVSTMDCEFWDAVNETWSTSGMQISRESHGDILICTSSHLTAFSKTMLVAPTFIDPLDFELFSNFFDNPVVVTVVLVVWMLYFFLVHWARQKDKLDREKAGVIYCSDNVATHTYSYVVCITTGWWNQAGTTANVYIYLKGALYNCPRKCLKTPERKCFQTGYEDWFLITTEHGLGDIKSVSLWHDNMGSSPHWFVNQVFVKDIQMDCSWTFVYNDWLAVDRGNLLMTTTTLKPVTEEELKLKRKYNFTVTSTQDLRDGHIWMSIFSKSASNTFTRVQRLTCCLTLLLTTMLTNLMFYGIPTDDPEDQLVTGGFRLSLSQIIIGVESGLIMFPMNLLIAQLFSRVKKKPQKEEPHIPIEHFLEAIYGTTWQKVMMDINERLMLLTKTHNIEGMKYFTRVPRPTEKTVLEACTTEVEKKKDGKIFPWWIVYIAWTLSITTCLTSSYFVALYGLKFGYTRSAEWLVSFFTGFFQSVFVQQPIKVFGIAFMLTLVFKKTANFDDSIPERKLDLDEEYLRSVCIKPPETHQLVMEPLPKRLLDQIKERLKIEWFMNVTIRDIILHIFYLSVILTMVHAHRNITHAFQNSETVRSLFVRPSNGFHLEKVTNAEEFYAYLHETVVPAMADITADHEYATLGSNHYLVGTYRLRQLRIKRDVCATVIPGDCKGPYSMNEEDTRDYNQSWSDIKSDDDDIVEIDHWTHRSTWDLQTLPYPGTHASYSGGGYVLELPANVALHSAIFSSVLNEGWIDDYTRAVFIEFTLYNPNVDLFTVCMYLFEFTNVGRVFPMNHEFTSSLYHYSTDYQIVVAVCEVLFVCFTILIVCIEVKKLKHVGKAEYFSDVWTFVELAQIALSIAVLGLFIKRFVTVDNVLQEFKDSQGKYFINFHSAIFWDFAFGYVSAVLITLMTLKTVKHVRYNKRIHIIFETLNIVRTVFLGYVLMFAIVTIAFAHTGFLMFGYYMGDYKTFYDSWFAIIIVLLGVGDFVGMQDSARIIGPLFIVAIIMTCQYVFLVMMTTILNVERLEAKHKLSKRKSKVTLIRYIISRVKLVLNIK